MKFLEVIIKFILSLFQGKDPETKEIAEPTPAPSLIQIPHIPQKGEKSETVKVLQKALNSKGAKLTVDGDFGNKTRDAVSAFQKSIKLPGSGVIGSKTLEGLGLVVAEGSGNKTEPPLQEPTEPDKEIALTAPLSWELPVNDGQVNQGAKPERKAWSEHLFNELNKNYDVLMSASDIREIIPDFDSRSRSQRLTALAELMSTVAEYESSWNPDTKAKDVNGSSEPGLMARGLFQMNADADQKNYRTGTNYKYQDLNDPLINIELGVKILVTVVNVRGKITFAKEEKSSVLRYFYATLLTNGSVGPKVLASAKQRIAKALGEKDVSSPAPKGKTPPWYTEAKKHEGKHETNSAFAAFMVPKWPLVGLTLNNIKENWAAWCGLAMAVALAGAGISHQKDGALAKNWSKYGVAVDYKQVGIPQGAIIHLNNKGNCASSSSNHVTQADGSCTAEHVNKAGATFNGYGGNQSNAWKVSTYAVSKICAVRWPKDYPKPPKVVQNKNCTSGKDGNESTR